VFYTTAYIKISSRSLSWPRMTLNRNSRSQQPHMNFHQINAQCFVILISNPQNVGEVIQDHHQRCQSIEHTLYNFLVVIWSKHVISCTVMIKRIYMTATTLINGYSSDTNE